MAQFSMEIMRLTGSVLRGNQQTEEQIQHLKSLAGEYGRVASAVETARALEELGFERQQMMRTELDQAIYAKIRDIGLDINSIDAQRISDAMRINKELQQQRDTAQEFADVLGSAFSDMFMQPLRDGEKFFDRMADGFAEIGRGFARADLKVILKNAGVAEGEEE